ncbi:MAG: hypothetical protein CML68_00750 [Rhodobacteraceae bacterium]|nr:hypothetical protein [Paracoccaceae bacterium]
MASWPLTEWCRAARNAGSFAMARKPRTGIALVLGPKRSWRLAACSCRPRDGLGVRSIDDWFGLAFFDRDFWIIWSTMFSFQPWHSLTEIRRDMRRLLSCATTASRALLRAARVLLSG